MRVQIKWQMRFLAKNNQRRQILCRTPWSRPSTLPESTVWSCFSTLIQDMASKSHQQFDSAFPHPIQLRSLHHFLLKPLPQVVSFFSFFLWGRISVFCVSHFRSYFFIFLFLHDFSFDFCVFLGLDFCMVCVFAWKPNFLFFLKFHLSSYNILTLDNFDLCFINKATNVTCLTSVILTYH